MPQTVRLGLIDLVNLDEKIIGIEKKISKFIQDITDQEHLLQQLTNSVDEHKQALFNQQKKVDLLELAMREIDAQEGKKKKALDAVSNQKEYTAIKKESAILALSRQDHEDKLISAWHELELLAKKVKKEQEETYQQQAETLEKKIAQLRQEIKSLQTQKQEFEEKQVAKLATIPPEWQAKYKRMKGKVSDPIVPVQQGSCSSCYYMILPQDLAKIKKGNMVPCRNCYRFLFYDETEEKAEEASY